MVFLFLNISICLILYISFFLNKLVYAIKKNSKFLFYNINFIQVNFYFLKGIHFIPKYNLNILIFKKWIKMELIWIQLKLFYKLWKWNLLSLNPNHKNFLLLKAAKYIYMQNINLRITQNLFFLEDLFRLI